MYKDKNPTRKSCRVTINVGANAEDRTQNFYLEGRCFTIKLNSLKLDAEKVRFELTSLFRLTVFKTAALNHSAISLILAGKVGIEPTT